MLVKSKLSWSVTSRDDIIILSLTENTLFSLSFAWLFCIVSMKPYVGKFIVESQVVAFHE